MTRPVPWRGIAEAVGTGAVVISLIYVGVQLNQNTRAVQAETSQSMYAQGAGRITSVLENPEVAELILRARRSPESLSPADSFRYNFYLNLQINEFEAAVSHMSQGTLEVDMARSWLVSMPAFSCRPGVREFWRQSRDGYIGAFRSVMDSVVANTTCADN